jgi:ATP-dependent Clp protease ATP-binding subunit ClpB
VILLDELEKAHPDVFNILLQLLDEGRLTDNKGRIVNFKNCIIIMTSNIGSDIIQENFMNISNEKDIESVVETTKIEVLERLKKVVRPEFLNRIDEIIMFQPLMQNQIKEIVGVQLDYLKKQLENNDIKIEFSDKVVNWLAEHGYEPQYGARPLKRLIQQTIVKELSKALLADTITKSDHIMVDIDKEQFTFKKK